MTLWNVSLVAMGLLLLQLVVIVFIRATSGETFGPKEDIGSALRRLAEERPIACRVYQACHALMLVELAAVVAAKLLLG